MFIKELCERTGCNPHQLRYYEQRGLLSPSRTPNGYRSYAAEAVEAVASIRALLAVGLSTRDIAQVLPPAGSRGDTRAWKPVLPFLNMRLRAIEQQVEELDAARRILLGCLGEMDEVETVVKAGDLGPRDDRRRSAAGLAHGGVSASGGDQ